MIHVCYGLHDRDGRYSKFTGTSMLSIFENVSTPPPSVTVHILHDNTLSYNNWRNFIYIAGRYGQRVSSAPIKFNSYRKNFPHTSARASALAPFTAS